jgi:hypothetical protein
LNSDRRLFENYEKLIVRRSLGFKGRFPYLPKILDLRPRDLFEVAMAIDSELGTIAFFTPLMMGFS